MASKRMARATEEDALGLTVAVHVPEGAEPREVVFEEALEAILFAAGHPVTYTALSHVFDMTPARIKDRVFEYALRYNAPQHPRGVILLTYTDSCQLCTKQDYLPEIRLALGIKKSGTLSSSSMEALAIVAYNQPVTRVFVDTLRRADSSYAMNNLIDRGLIESKGRLDVPGRPMIYGTTSDFLRCFGFNSLEDLPRAEDELMDMFQKAKDKENAEAQAAQSDETDGEQLSLDDESTAPLAVPEDAESMHEPTAEDDPPQADTLSAAAEQLVTQSETVAQQAEETTSSAHPTDGADD